MKWYPAAECSPTDSSYWIVGVTTEATGPILLEYQAGDGSYQDGNQKEIKPVWWLKLPVVPD